MLYKCLRCAYEFKSVKSDDKLVHIRQCPSCYSSRVIPRESYDQIIREIQRGNPGPFIDALIGIIAKTGLTGRFLETLQIIRRLVKEAEELKEWESKKPDASVVS